MNKNVKIISEDLAYRYKPNNSIEKEMLDRVRSITMNNEFAGNFYSSSWTGGGDGYLYQLDDYDKHFVRRINLKKGEKIYRYFTRRSAIGSSTPLIKINTEKGMLYFLKPDDEDLDVVEFETKGVPVRYLNLVETEDDIYADGGELKSYLSSRTDMFDDNAKTLTKKDLVDFINISSGSDKKYSVKNVDTGYSYYIYKGKLRMNDSTEGIFKATLTTPDRFDNNSRFKIQEEVLYDWEKEKDPSIVKVGWDAIKQKFDNIFWMEQDGDDEIFANEVKLEESTTNYDGRPSPYKKRVSFSDAKSMFLKSLTDEEKAMIDLEYDYQDVHELFGLMSEKKIIVKRKKENDTYADGGEVGDWKSNSLGDGYLQLYNSDVYIRDNGGNYGRGRYDVYKRGEYDRRTSFRPSILMASMDDLEEAKKYGYNNRYENGGKLAWQSVEVGDNALVKSEYKMGVVVVTYGRRFHLRFPDGSEKTYSAEDLEFLPSDSYANGGKIEELVGRGITQYDMGVSEPIYYTISRVEMSPPYFAHKTLRIYHKYGNSELVDVLEDEQIDELLNGEEVQIRTSGGDYYAIQLKEKMQSKMKKGGMLGGVKMDMLYDKNGERRVDPEALAYIENTVEMLPQTKFMHTNIDGKYTAKRKKLHDKIVAHFHEDKPCVNKRPAVAILTGGAPASGKTTFIKKYVDLDPDKVYHVDADEVRAMLPEYKGYNASQTHLETADIVNRLIDDIGIPCDHDLIYDGTMNKATKYQKIVDKLHKLGYKVFVVYISIPEQVSKERVIARYKKAGRYVPLKVIEEVYDNGLTAFEKVAREMADGYIRIDGMSGQVLEKGGIDMPKNIEYAEGGEVEKSYLKNADSLVRSAERYAEQDYGKSVKKGKGMARAYKKDGKMRYSEVIVFFTDGEQVIYDESDFPKFFMKDGGELGNQDFYDGFQMQVVTKKGNPDKEVQKQNARFTYRKGGKL